jgi:hypothetical protein
VHLAPRQIGFQQLADPIDVRPCLPITMPGFDVWTVTSTLFA